MFSSCPCSYQIFSHCRIKSNSFLLQKSQHFITKEFKTQHKFHCWTSSTKIRWQSKEESNKSHRKQIKAKASEKLVDDLIANGAPQEPEKRGTVIGAVSLIVGTSIGSGMLALPQKTSPAGFIPSMVCIVICWAFLVIEALLLAEINIYLRRKMKKDEKQGNDLEVVSLTTMAQETLGSWAGNLATVTYLFLAYTSVVAYTTQSGEILSHLIDIPISLSGNIFTLILALLILVGGTDITDKVNQWMTIIMIGFLTLIEVTATISGGTLDSSMISNWSNVPQTIPVIIFSLVYHDIMPVICAYLGGDISRVRFSIVAGSLVPLCLILIWNYISLGFSLDFIGNTGLFDSDFREIWSALPPPIVEGFSILAVATSLIGTLLGFSEFFIEQFANLYLASSPREERTFILDEGNENKTSKVAKISESPNFTLFAIMSIIFPSMIFSIVVPDAFSAATNFAGGYCMVILFGVLPPAMAQAMDSIAFDYSDNQSKDKECNSALPQLAFSRVKPLLTGASLFSGAVILEETFRDLSSLISFLFPVTN